MNNSEVLGYSDSPVMFRPTAWRRQDAYTTYEAMRQAQGPESGRTRSALFDYERGNNAHLCHIVVTFLN
jgi:hypothetical protein